jgi:PAS domain S-box-containing protein
MSSIDRSGKGVSGIEEVLITEELGRRVGRAPDHAAENRALGLLTQEMATSPDSVLQKLTNLMVEFGWAHSAGVSILDPHDASSFHWKVVSGLWAEHVGGTMPFDASPCGIVITRNSPLLFARPHEHFPAANVEPLIREILLVPFYVAGRPAGTLWAVAHDDERKFDAEDLRVFTNLARFASAAYQMSQALAEAQQGQEELERRVKERAGELIRANECLGVSEERLRALVTATSYAVYSMGPDWTEMRQMDGRGFLADTSGPSGTWLDEYIPPDDQSEVREAIGRAIQTKSTFDLEHRVRRADGTLGWTHSRAVPLLDVAGEIREWFGAASDVTARKRTETALRESEERFRQFGDASSDVLWIRDAEMLRWEYLTPAFEQIYGMAVDRALSGDTLTNWLELIVPEDREHALSHIMRVCVGERVTFEYRIRRSSDGKVRWLRNTDFPLPDEKGRVRRIGGIGHDITDLKEAEEQLRESEARLRATVDAVPQIAWTGRGQGAGIARGARDERRHGRRGDGAAGGR